MSIYRKFNRAPADDLHHFERQRQRPGERDAADAGDWLPKRKAKPYDQLLATTAAWSAAFAPPLQPKVLCQGFPRIANALASGWRDVDSTLRYLDDLLTDKRGGRKGFPAEVLGELHALRSFYETQHAREGWRRA
jgi:hypothetical protein